MRTAKQPAIAGVVLCRKTFRDELYNSALRLSFSHVSLTYSMVQSPSWEANRFSASQEIPRISLNPKVHYRTHKRPPPVSILGQPNPVHIPTSHLLEIHPNIIHPSTPRSPQWSLSLRHYHERNIYKYHQTQQILMMYSLYCAGLNLQALYKEFYCRYLKTKDQLDITCYFYFTSICAQHVSDINISIIRSFRLLFWITTLVLLFLVRCVLEFRCGWVGVVSVLQAETYNTDTTPTQPL